MEDTHEDRVYNEVLGENNAQVVLREIEGLENEGKLLVSRWIWELIQNARGTAGSQQDLIVSLERTEDSLVFRHNGSKFQEKEVLHLILHGSTKSGPDDIGRFGTGFITTHLINRRVRVRGTLESESPFDFWLDRSANTPADLQEQMKRSWASFCASRKEAIDRIASPFTTEFTYPINNSAVDAVDGGIRALVAAAPYLFAFNPMLRRVAVSDRGVRTDIEVVDGFRHEDGGHKLFRIQINGTNQATVVSSSAADVSAALLLQADAQAAFIKPPTGVPRLFIAFPLNGLERFPLPAVVNSEQFFPLQDRDGIPLAAGSNKKNETNQALFLQACRRVIDLFAYAASKDWSGIPDAVRIMGDENVRGADPKWLKETVRSTLVAGLRQIPILTSITDEKLAPVNAWIPVTTAQCTSHDLWRLGSQLRAARSRLPTEEEIEAWSTAIADWRRFAAPNEPTWPESWTVRELAAQVASRDSLTALQENLEGDGDAATWLRGLYDCLAQSSCTDLLQTLGLVPNQKGVLKKTSSLARDGGIGEDLKDVAETLGVQLRAELIDKSVANHPVFGGLPIRTDEQVLTDLIERMKRVFKDPLPETMVATNAALFRALLTRSKHDKLDGYPVASVQGAQDKRAIIKLQASTSASRRCMAPVPIWTKTAQAFASVFSEAIVIAPEYADGVGEASWTTLEQKGFVHRDPIFSVAKVVTSFLPDDPLPDEEKDARTEKAFTQSNVAWGAVDDHSIFDRARTSNGRSVGLLRFFLEHALVVDEHALDKEEAACENGKMHRFYQAEWLAPLRSRSWVNVGTKKTDLPSVNSFSILLATQPQILARLNEPKVAEFFRAIGVPPSELLLRTIAGSDVERMTLIQSIATIADAFQHDAERVKALATALREDAGMIELIEERQADREKVARNQKLGEVVERVFAAVLGASVKVIRTGPGHDYALLTPDQDDGGQFEIQSGPRRVFVEIKATASNAVRMSRLQATIAVSNCQNYALCVVPRASVDLTEESFKENARFVFSIGEMLKPAWLTFSKYDQAYQQTHTGSDVAVEVGDHDIKFRVQEPAWKDASSYGVAVQKLGMLLAVPTPIVTETIAP
jgi:hypothetical protein